MSDPMPGFQASRAWSLEQRNTKGLSHLGSSPLCNEFVKLTDAVEKGNEPSILSCNLLLRAKLRLDVHLLFCTER
uniref:Uncharacterized protein n=1 Tax=Physcomitrium patens TaxID=3218 RepID=A0A2K1L0X3_PHYPA|nr:hypothetical protein PHYPA_002466 [Physcomitrium patens]